MVLQEDMQMHALMWFYKIIDHNNNKMSEMYLIKSN